jgi:hypothetical protein
VLDLNDNSLAFHAAGKGQNLFDQIRAALGVFADNRQPTLRFLIKIVELEHLGRHQNRREDIVKIVRDAARERAD